jgi:heterodisulfide reductase subunit D
MGLIGWIKGEKVLYYPGCLVKGVLKQQFENYKEIFNRLGVDFVMLPNDESCCGLPVLNAGYRKDARKLAEKNFELFKKRGVKKIVTNCPSCYHTFISVYPKMVRGWDIEVEHASVFILNRLKRKGIRYKGKEEDREVVMYHDSCHLGRYSGIYEEPREVVRLLGGRLLEFSNNRENSVCCGAGGGVRANFPEIAKSAAKRKMREVPEDVGKVVSACGLCYANLKSGSEKSIEFSDFVLGKLRRMRR